MGIANDYLSDFRKIEDKEKIRIINNKLLEKRKDGRRKNLDDLKKELGFGVSPIMKEIDPNFKLNRKTNQYEIEEQVEEQYLLTKADRKFLKQLRRNFIITEESELLHKNEKAKNLGFRMFESDHSLFILYCKENHLKIQDAVGVALRNFVHEK